MPTQTGAIARTTLSRTGRLGVDRAASDDLVLRAVRGDLARALCVWGVGSMLVGGTVWAVAVRDDSERLAGAGRQVLAWGTVDALIAALAFRQQGRPVPDPGRERARLRRLLWLNSVLDVGYLAAAATLLRRGRIGGRDVTGDGLGVAVQGGFLLLLDVKSVLRLRVRTTQV